MHKCIIIVIIVCFLFFCFLIIINLADYRVVADWLNTKCNCTFQSEVARLYRAVIGRNKLTLIDTFHRFVCHRYVHCQTVSHVVIEGVAIC